MSIALGKVFEPFVEQRPICVMARGVLEHLFNASICSMPRGSMRCLHAPPKCNIRGRCCFRRW